VLHCLAGMLSPAAPALTDSNLSVPCAGPLSIHTSCWVQSPNLHLTPNHLLLQQAFGGVFSAGGKISTSGWWGVLAGRRCNTAVPPGHLEMQKKVGWVVSSTIWGYSCAGYNIQGSIKSHRNSYIFEYWVFHKNPYLHT